MTDELKQEMTEKFNSSYGEEVKIGLREALRKIYIDGGEHGYQYAVDKVCEWLSNNLEYYLGDYNLAEDELEDNQMHYAKMLEGLRKAMDE